MSICEICEYDYRKHGAWDQDYPTLMLRFAMLWDRHSEDSNCVTYGGPATGPLAKLRDQTPFLP